MKKISLALFIAVGLFTLSSCNKSAYTVTFTVSGAEDGWIIMQQREEGSMVKKDSTELKDGKAVVKGNIDLPEFFYVSVKGVNGYMPLFIEPGTIQVTAEVSNLREAKVVGSKTNDEFVAFNASLATFDEQGKMMGDQYSQARQLQDTATMNLIEKQYSELENEQKEFILNYAITNNKTVVAPFVIVSNSYLYDLDDLKKVNASFDPSIAGSTYVSYLTDRVTTLETVAIGQPFVDFALNTPEGSPLALSSVVGDGKYVLVDFWASWCGPCRAENPNVVLAYTNFQDKGFTVFGVSLDNDQTRWVNAIEEDSLTWTHVSDLKYWGSEAGKLYGVQSIPHNVLIDPNGIIIAKDLRGQELQDKLAELMN